ncbi:MAG: septum site-determining protein MinC, partial [Lachnospiraceae bacterium]|nr:septum site-determining protein MinC [Lachnospiraceae bacterium]
AGNDSAFVAALDMEPMQIRIADSIARSGDGKKSRQPVEPMIAYTEDGNIYMEPLTKEAINDIRI